MFFGFVLTVFLLQYETCHISGHSKMSGLLILSQTTIKFPSEFFGPFRLLSIPNINRPSLTARDLGGRRERREIAEDIPGGRRWRESVPVFPGPSQCSDTRDPGPGQLSECPVISRPRHMSVHIVNTGGGTFYRDTVTAKWLSEDRTMVA